MKRSLLKVLREIRGYSQLELAKKIGTTPALISDYERYRRRPSYERLLELARFLRVDPAILLYAFVNKVFVEHNKKTDINDNDLAGTVDKTFKNEYLQEILDFDIEETIKKAFNDED